MYKYKDTQSTSYTVNGKTFHIDRSQGPAKEIQMIDTDDTSEIVEHTVTLYVNGSRAAVFTGTGRSDEQVISDKAMVELAISRAESKSAKEFLAKREELMAKYTKGKSAFARVGRMLNLGKYGKLAAEIEEMFPRYVQIQNTLTYLDDLKALIPEIEKKQAKVINTNSSMTPEELSEILGESVVTDSQDKSMKDYEYDRTFGVTGLKDYGSDYIAPVMPVDEAPAVDPVLDEDALAKAQAEAANSAKPKSVAMQRWEARMAKVKAEQEKRNKPNGGQPNGPS